MDLETLNIHRWLLICKPRAGQRSILYGERRLENRGVVSGASGITLYPEKVMSRMPTRVPTS